MRIAALAMAAALLAGCQAVQQQTAVVSPTAQTITAGVGDVMLRAEERESLPNAFGRADLFGRTRPTGITTVQYGGLRDGRAVLLRSGTAIQSTATTMSETPGTATIFGARGNPVGWVETPPIGSQMTSAQLPTIPIVVDWRSRPRVPVAGRSIVILGADSTSVTFRVE